MTETTMLQAAPARRSGELRRLVEEHLDAVFGWIDSAAGGGPVLKNAEADLEEYPLSQVIGDLLMVADDRVPCAAQADPECCCTFCRYGRYWFRGPT